MSRIDDIADERLNGHLICYNCNARNPKGADFCRKCGNNQFREKIRDLNKNRS